MTTTVNETKAVKAETVSQESKTRDELILEKLKSQMSDTIDAMPTVRCIFFGDVGGGKTTAACDGPDVLLYAIEKGQSSLANHPDILAKVKKVLHYTSVKQAELLADQLKKGLLPDFKTIVIDTFSELTEDALDNRVIEQHRIDGAHDQFRPEGGDYQANTQHMRRIASAFKDVPVNVVFVCHDKVEKNEKTGLVSVRPSPTEKVYKTINQYADIIAYFWNEEDSEGQEHFYARLRRGKSERGMVTAKTRIKNLDTVIENFTLQTALDANAKRLEDIKKMKKVKVND